MKNYLLLLVLFPFLSLSQKKVIDHTVYDSWKKIENAIVSNDGRFVAYEITPHKGDGFLYIYHVESGRLDSIFRAKEPKFSPTSDMLAFRITPEFDTLRKVELEKVDKKKWPKDSLGIYVFAKDTLLRIPKIKTYKFNDSERYLFFTVDENKLPEAPKAPEPKKKKKEKKKKKNSPEVKPVEYKSDGTVLTLFDPADLGTTKFKDVVDYSLAEKSSSFAFVTHKKEKEDSFYLHIYKDRSTLVSEFPGMKSYRQLNFSENGEQLAFMQSMDTNKVKQFDLYLYNLSSKEMKQIAKESVDLVAGKGVSEHYKPLFSLDGRFLFFGVADSVKPEPKDTLLESEKAKVDIWHYLDHRIQPQQLKQLKSDQKRTDLHVYHLGDGSIRALSNDTLRTGVNKHVIGDYLFGSTQEAYAIVNNWDFPSREDHYRISLLTGEKELIKKEVRLGGDLSPKGRFYTWFDAKNGQHYLKDLEKGTEFCMTCSVKNVNWTQDENGLPMLAYPHGVIGYAQGESAIWIQSEYDIWTYDTEKNTLSCLTFNEGATNKIRLRPRQWDRDSMYYSFENLILEGFNEKTKGTHYYKLVDHGDHNDLIEKYYTDHKVTTLTRSKGSEAVLLRKMSVNDYPELRLTSIDFNEEKIISNTNPQQSEFNWATVELVSWKSYSGIPLEGLLYKPENFDPTKSYPLMVYFYELYSDELHNHHIPKPTASIIFPTEYASSGYIVFIPDIRYTPGKPAKSAYDCIMSGTDHVLKLLPNIDPKRLGLQGQSWGGYQTAQLITMTDRYAAAMAGAPVSNMFSAYGGIRWGSGMNRQFQYERTQSRIGKTIWEAPELYIENSPLFHLPKVKTPLMIMHNDEDGAVPWYQGIELYTGMRRLGKACWMLNYNGDDHNLMKNANRIDLSIRMKQFFDHYLMNGPEPKWMSDGIPAVDKGKDLGY
jgi:dipeptidyl aminopeptidase/acylaminoacyl peptidase